MSLQWALVEGFLYAEVALLMAMCLPLFSVQRWRRILRSRLLRKLDAHANVYFNVLLGLLVILLLDAGRKWRNHSSATHGLDERTNPHGWALARLHKVRAHGNVTVAGGALLLWLALKWMVRTLIGRAFAEEGLATERLRADQLVGQLAEARREIDALRRQLDVAAAAATASGAAASGGSGDEHKGDKKSD